jgi:hypothetical protein
MMKASFKVPLNLWDSQIPKSAHIIQNCYGGRNLDCYDGINITAYLGITSWDCDIHSLVPTLESKYNRYLDLIIPAMWQSQSTVSQETAP